MFKLQFNRDAVDRRADNVTGHDRFCQTNVKHFSLPRYKRKQRSNRTTRTQEETELVFELSQVTPNQGLINSVNHHQRDRREFSSQLKSQSSSSRLYDAQFQRSYSEIIRRDNEADARPDNERQQRQSSWNALSRCFSTIAGSLTCRDFTKHANDRNETTTATSDLLQQGTSGSSGSGLNNGIPNATYFANNPTMEKRNARVHALCMNYLESATERGRYVLVTHLPQIGSRSSRLWYLVYDTNFRTERLLTITHCSERMTQNLGSTSSPPNELKQICQGLQHAYVSPILDLAVLNDNHLGGQFVLTLTAVISDGSLRDLLHRSRWTDSWQTKYKYPAPGCGIPEDYVQRLSCHILVALLHLRSRGLPPGIGIHFHSGNILIQQGTARFSAVDNILFSHPASNTFISDSKNVLNPESLDSFAFANLLFYMCSGYELPSMKLTQDNWADIQAYSQVSEVIEFILGNPESSLPHIHDIAKLEFYRNLDLRELRALPAPKILSGPPKNALNLFVERLEMNHNGSTLQKAHSISTPSVAAKTTEDNSPRASINQLIPNGSRNSSQLSLYWTPPNSLGFITKASSNDSKLEQTTIK